MEMGKSSSGLYAESHWLKNTDDGVARPAAWARGYNLEVGPVMLNAGAESHLPRAEKAITASRFRSAAE